MKSFDRVAAVYQALEYVAFGRALERVRFCYLPHLRDCRDLLVIGEGDGRFLQRLLKVAPDVRVRCVDASQAMLARAARRLSAVERGRVSFECVDVRMADVAPAAYDGIVTMFVLDCFSADDVAALSQRLARGLRPQGLWLFGDFAIPAAGWRRWRAIVWVQFLYAFFRWQTGLDARVVPPSEEILRTCGLHVSAAQTFQQGLLRAVLFEQTLNDCG